MFPNIKKLCCRIKAARIAAKLAPSPFAAVEEAARADEIHGPRSDSREFPVKSAALPDVKTGDVSHSGSKEAACSLALIDEIRGLRSDLREFMAKSAALPGVKTGDVAHSGDVDVVQ